MASETADSPTALSANAYTRAGSTFDDWNTAPGGNGTSYLAGATYPFTSNITLYAIWSENPVDIVTFNSEGGTAESSQSAPDGSLVTLPTPTDPGSTFDGWFTGLTVQAPRPESAVRATPCPPGGAPSTPTGR